MRKQFVVIVLVTLAMVASAAWFWPSVLWTLVVIGPLIILGVIDMTQTRQVEGRPDSSKLVVRGRSR